VQEQVKSGRERSMPCEASEEWRDKEAQLEGPSGLRGRVRATWWQEKQDEVVNRSRCRVEAHDWSLDGVLRRFTTKPSCYLVEQQNQDRRLGGRRWDLGAPRSFDAGEHVTRSQDSRQENAVCGDGVAVR
jgi:hypothetical protein